MIEHSVEQIRQDAINAAHDAGYLPALGCGAERLRASAGKFEGEPWYAPYYWDAVLSGVAEEWGSEDDLVSILDVTADERAAFGFTDDITHVAMFEDSNGFIWLRELTVETYDQLGATYMSDNSDDNADTEDFEPGENDLGH